jgi:DNA-binding transcriptional ArsR family regulator
MEVVNKLELDIQPMELKKAALVIRAVNHKLRQNIIKLIHDAGSIIVTDIYKKLDLEQSVASQHLAILRKAGFVRAERKGKCIYYSINYHKFTEVNNFMKKLLH